METTVYSTLRQPKRSAYKHSISAALGCLGLIAISMQSACVSATLSGENAVNSAEKVAEITPKNNPRAIVPTTSPIEHALDPTLSPTHKVQTTVRSATTAARDTSILVDNYPNKHVVVKGDTLWDISARFLRDPWLWPQVWDNNQQIRNPHLIYPGDIITLRWCDGRPCFGFGESSGDARLSPQVQYEDLNQAIPTIPYAAIAGFLSKPTVLDADYAKTLPYVLASADGRLIMSQGNDVYVRGGAVGGGQYNIFHLGDPYVDPETGYVYGLEALYVGEGNIFRSGDPSTMEITRSRRETLRGDRLMHFDNQDIGLNFSPKAAGYGLNGRIISVVEGVDYIGQYDIVVINRGANVGLTQGDVVSIFQKGERIYDPYDRTNATVSSNEKRNWLARLTQRNKGGDYVKLPDESAGVGMIFRVYPNISYALVMRAEREIHKGDLIRSPQ